MYDIRHLIQAIGSPNGLAMYLHKSNAQIDQLVELVRGKLSKMARTTLGALTVIDVHGQYISDQEINVYL